MLQIENPRECHLWGFLARYGELLRKKTVYKQPKKVYSYFK